MATKEMLWDPRYKGKWDFEFHQKQVDAERVYGKLNWGLWFQEHEVCLFYHDRKNRSN